MQDALDAHAVFIHGKEDDVGSVRAGAKTWLEIRTLDIREWRAGDPVCVTEQLVFELVGALRVVERNKVRDFGEIPLRPS